MKSIRACVTVLSLCVAGLALTPAAPAAADPGSDVTDLQAALAACAGSPYRVALTQDLSGPTTVLEVGCDTVLDLAGHDLTVRSVQIGGGQTLEVTDSTTAATAGVLTADARASEADQYYGPAGIRNGGPLVSSGFAHVRAYGGFGSAGVGGQGGGGGRDGGDVTARGHSTIEAVGGHDSAGIGGAEYGGNGTVRSEDFATIRGTTGDHGAGIGFGRSGRGGANPVVADDDSVITGLGVEGGAGIGGGLFGTGGATVVANDRATINADGDGDGDGYGYAGIGRGAQSPSGQALGAVSVTVNDEATVVAHGKDGASAVGDDAAAPTGILVTVNGGTLRLRSNLVVPNLGADPSVVVAAAGTIERDPATSAGLTGAGTVSNGGAITVPTDGVTVAEVTGRHTTITYDADGGTPVPAPTTVFADTLAHGDRTLPPSPERAGHVFTGWVTGAGADPLGIDTDLTVFGSSTDGTAVAVTARASWQQIVDVPAPTLSNTSSATRGTGAPAVGDVLLASTGPTSPSGADVTFTWQRTARGSTTPVAAATGPTYELTPSDLGATFSVVADAELAPYAPGTGTSQPTGVVRRSALYDLPRIGLTGPSLVGRRITVTLPAWTPTPRIMWQRDGVAIAGATGLQHVLTAADLGHRVAAKVTFSKAGYVDRNRFVGRVVRPGRQHRVPVPAVRGTARVGRVLTAVPGAHDAGATLTYRWSADGVVIRRGTGPRLRLRPVQWGRRITVTVTSVKTGYRSTVRTSTPTDRVQRR
ncbi:InlB B-repeat-containing protein [Nocardioides sp. 503]|uniref:InlB B-repeat-containing protein n=1 Tax=Nocardioides sp. 503 TaxID=2508326 RepID=UPI00142F57F7|nr:InlB B-repeat-containing protein [Nocardioides sp. 503]